jgi:hypothetical protein
MTPPEFLDVLFSLDRVNDAILSRLTSGPHAGEWNPRALTIGKAPHGTTTQYSTQVRWTCRDLRPGEILQIHNKDDIGLGLFQDHFCLTRAKNTVASGIPAQVPNAGQQLKWQFEVCMVDACGSRCLDEAVRLMGRRPSGRYFRLDPIIIIEHG